MRVTVEYNWSAERPVTLDEGGRLRFPRFGAGAGIYRLEFREGTVSRWYYGQASDLDQRLQRYRTPGTKTDTKGGQTNRRLGPLMCSVLVAGGTMRIAVVQDAVLELDGKQVAVNLDHEPIRLMVENIALLAAAQQGLTVLNL
jgi:hypothetical protein